MYIFVYICMYICIYVCIYMYMCIYIHICMHTSYIYVCTFMCVSILFVVPKPCYQLRLMDKILHLFYTVASCGPPTPMFNIDMVCRATTPRRPTDRLRTHHRCSLPMLNSGAGRVVSCSVLHYICYMCGAGFCPSTVVRTHVEHILQVH